LIRADTLPVYNIVDPTKISQFVISKSHPQFNSKPQWDLVDAMEQNAGIIDTLDLKTLDDSLKTKSRKELREIVEASGAKRKHILNQITDLSIKQDNYIKAEKEKLKTNEPLTLESEIERIIHEQVKRVNMKIR